MEVHTVNGHTGDYHAPNGTSPHPKTRASPPSSPPSSIYSAASIDEIHAALAELGRHEASVTARLDALVASQNELSRELGRLDLLRANLGSQAVAARAISQSMLSTAANTAQRISSAVKRLDTEQANVKATLDVVEQVAELKACVLGVHGSMGAPQDWETAASYLHRASLIPAEVVDGSFAEEIVPTTEVPDPPRVTLDAAAESLCGLFLREFEKATKDGDGARVTRFFKLFPLIGRSDVGLDAYGKYVCQGVAARARATLHAGTGANQRREALFYATALTKLFEHIAQIVEGHQPLVEQHYGQGRMIKVVERLQAEADVQGGIILDTWTDERAVNRKLMDVKSYPYSFLVQSFAQAQKPTATFRAESPFKRDGTPSGRPSEDEGVDMKEIDSLLGESAIMLGRWALYTRFLASKAPSTGLDGSNDGSTASSSDHVHLTLPTYIAESNLNKKISNLLIDPFNLMSTFFFRRSVEKAFQLAETPPDLTLNMNKPITSNAPFITSAVDDVMYMVNQVLQRSLATSQRAIVGSVVPTVSQVLGSDFIGMLQRKMRDEYYPKAAIQGALPPEEKIVQFVVLINSLDVTIEYLKRIVDTHLGQTTGPTRVDGHSTTDTERAIEHFRSMFPFGNDAVFVVNTLINMQNSVTTKANQLLTDGVEVTFHQVLKPRVRPILADAFRDVDYSATSMSDNDDYDDVDNDGSAEDIVSKRFTTSWNTLTRPLRRLMTKTAWDKLQAHTLPYLASSLERRLWSMNGRLSELGATRLERDLSGIISVACGEGKYELRDHFQKCQQIVMIAGMEEEEWDEINAGGIEEEESPVLWVLSREERTKARNLLLRER
ncbi:uncharacterized protein PV09_05696 [Verruconis gallopava]|uniref:Conserved oligomeric Golgi complex subunit 4 n=1 Tax=Verruconis gallopava TaxID=253628 RepID=A0A0D2AV97_9PEZI|nr:uncharacterized protein PV09_05696 [Verruconis gallopava]KIW03044.1 hypothetical protein PV09_05696 [Verruconis gallopava]